MSPAAIRSDLKDSDLIGRRRYVRVYPVIRSMWMR